MAKRTTTSYLVLGLLAGRDWTAYELGVQLGRGMDVLWARATRQLYNVPKQLVTDGLASSRKEVISPSKRLVPGARKRTVYSITEEGRVALREWHTTDAAPPALEFEGMIRLMFPDGATIEEFRRNLEVMIEQAQQSRQIFVAHAEALVEVAEPMYPQRHHLFAMANRFCVDHFNNIEQFATWALQQTETWPDPISPSETHRSQTRAVLQDVIARSEALRP